MKRWLIMVAFTVTLPIIALACGDDDKAGPGSSSSSGTPTSTVTNTVPTSTATVPDGGNEAGPAKRTGCLDRPTDVERPDRLPCNLIPPGLTL
jgi:hypothetical protein